MIYYSENNIVIRSMQITDASKLVEGFKKQGWRKPFELFMNYYKEQEDGKRYVLVAELCGEVAGYATLLPKALTGPFEGKDIPEICDFNVFIKFQKKGIGNLIVNIAEGVAAEISDRVSLGVGLHYGYGSAQRIYVKRGYIPDGSGVWYMDKQLEQYADCNNNDELILYFSKLLR